MNIVLEHPWALLILLLVLPLALMAMRSRAVLGPGKAWGGLAIRVLVLLLLTFALAQPSIVRESDAMSVLVVSDASDSVPLALRTSADVAVREAVMRKDNPLDRVGLVTVARTASIGALPSVVPEVSTMGHAGDLQATDLSVGVRIAIATRPADTTARIVLLSDGNETSGNLMDAADAARAAGIPIDVVPLEFVHPNEVVVENVRAPTRAREGQSMDLRVSIRSQAPMRGVLKLWQNDQPVDMDPDSDALGLGVELEAGPNLVQIPVVADGNNTQRFRVEFEPADPAQDQVPQNNVGAAVVFVGGTGRVLIIEPTGGQEGDALRRALEQSKIETARMDPEQAIGAGLTSLAGFDAVVLANVPRWAFDNEFDRQLHAYVHDLGGGLMMLGGPESFGAGGWLGSETAKVLPVRLDPPQTRQIMRGALAILLHACEMPEGNYWGKVVAESSIKALSSADYAGLISYTGQGPLGYTWSYPLQVVGNKAQALQVANSMMVGDMPSFAPPMEMILQAMTGVRAGQKHTIVISDGDPSPPAVELLNEYKAAKVTVTTVLITGSLGHGSAEDNRKMQAIADKTGGRFYKVDKPNKLPQIFIQEASLVSRSLIVEGDFTPSVAPQSGGPIMGFNALPQVRGYVLTVPREGLAQLPVTVRNDQGNDPLLSYWNYGLGRSVCYMSDLSGRWGAAGTGWSQFQPFWEQVTRWLLRPAMPQDVSVATRVDGDRAFVDVETREQQGGFAAATHASARLILPDGTATDLPLRQTGPGRFTGEFPVTEAGAYLTNIAFARSAEGGTARSGTVQAAISVPYPAEYRATRDNSALLRAVAERTGGRVLRLQDAKTWQLYERADLGTAMSAKVLWQLAAILAGVLLLLDVAWRRIAFDARDARELAQRVTGGAVSAGSGGVDALRRARSGVA
ncbi:MAG: VWA domain-containing protein, partial [Phycisphaerae bacterium]|nr:VWA domain-containing protein [Phycisphaerae bacterium]